MSEDDSFALTAVLVPGSGTASLLRIVSTLHRRGARVHEMSFEDSPESSATVSLRISATNTGGAVIESSLRRLLDVAEVTCRPEHHWKLLHTGTRVAAPRR
jgi:acetolactate synthase regulatory subunit